MHRVSPHVGNRVGSVIGSRDVSLFRRIFDSAYRRARRAEGKGEYREAAALYVEADMPDEAAHAFLVHATRAKALDDRLASYQDALRWLPVDHPRRGEIEAQIGLSVLDEAQRRGVHTAEEKRRLGDAAQSLESGGRDAEAATAFEILGRMDDVARCLEKAGEVERLETLLQGSVEEARREQRLRRLVSDYEMAVAVGARLEALAALAEAVELAPEDVSLASLLRGLEARMLRGRRLRLRVGTADFAFFAEPRVVLGRDADVSVRGASVSRRHAEVAIEEGGLVVRDVGSRNGTLVHGVPIAGDLRVDGSSEIGLGDDVEVRVAIQDGCLHLRVLRGLDRDLVVLAGECALRPEGLRAEVSFEGGHPRLTAMEGASAQLGRQPVAAPIVLLREDVIDVDGVRVVVL